ncbi:MAG: glycoside hydrolase family 19 protein [Flavobacterium sp.]|nr:glycoside hydrolase family 19 protein [Flavobacterium sp.]
MRLDEKYKSLLDKNEINTPLRVAHFMAQIQHESGLKPISENLNYSRLRLGEIFPKYFKTMAEAQAYANKPQMIANRVYANRMGNGNEQSGEGFKYRGRGFLQITGKENYTKLANDTGIDCLENPDSLLIEPNAMVSAIWFWKTKGLNIFADEDNISTITNRINGGYNGIDHRKELLTKWKNIV